MILAQELMISTGGAETAEREAEGSANCREESAAAPETVRDVFKTLFRSPSQKLLRQWNWKAALLSSLFRAILFFFANLGAGLPAALAAMLREFCFRSAASGFYGALTESFRLAQPRWLATLVVLVLLPLANHSGELLVHWYLGTARLKASILTSVAFTVLSTSFNLFAMRRGVLITGKTRQSLAQDFACLPRLALSFCCSLARLPWQALKGLWGAGKKGLNLVFRGHLQGSNYKPPVSEETASSE